MKIALIESTCPRDIKSAGLSCLHIYDSMTHSEIYGDLIAKIFRI